MLIPWLLHPIGGFAQCTAGQTTILDIPIDHEMLIKGGMVLAENAVPGDTISVKLLDLDAVIDPNATPQNPTIIRENVPEWFVMPGHINEIEDDEQTASCPAGLYLRFTYISTGQTDVNLIVNVKAFRGLDG